MSDSREIIKILSTEDAAKALNDAGYEISARTLDNWRSLSKGPKPTKLGRKVGYTIESLNAYIKKCTGFDSTHAA